MPSTKVADKTTLDLVKTDTTSLLSRGGAKSDGNGGLLVYNPNTNTWDTISGGGGSNNPTITVYNTDMAWSGKNVTILDSTTQWQTTVEMPNSASVQIQVPYIDSTYIVHIDSEDAVDKEIEILGIGNYIANNLRVFLFNNETSWEDINKMLSYHYNNILDLKDYWSVGDTKMVHLSAMASQPEQDVIFAIADFEHDDLVTPINGKTKATMTLTQVDCLIEQRYITSASSSSIKYSTVPLRSWLNNTYYNSLPNDLKSLIKNVKKTTASGYSVSSNETTNEYCWLLAAGEIFGNQPASSTQYTYYSNLCEYNALTQYPYYAISTNIIKKCLETNTSYWERSPTFSSYQYWCEINTSGAGTVSFNTSKLGVAPCICL